LHVDPAASSESYLEEMVDDPERRRIGVTDSGRAAVDVGVCFGEAKGNLCCGDCRVESDAVGDDREVWGDKVCGGRVDIVAVAAIVVLG
jgi:hypothetical protein